MNFEPFNPPAPGQINLTRFQDLRNFLMSFVVNRWMQYVNIYMQSSLLPTLNSTQYGLGPDIASGPTISPSGLVQRITGTAAISTINAPLGFTGAFYAIAQDGFSTVTGGNILLAVSVPANHMAIFAYQPAMQMWGVATS